MGVNLEKLLCWKEATAAEIAMLNDLQANILKAHGRDHAAHVFLQFDSWSEGRAFIRDIAGWVKSARQQLDEAEVFKALRRSSGRFVALFLSAAGYRALGVEPERTPPEKAFHVGMRQRSEELGDLPSSCWEQYFQKQIHAMILIADSTDHQVARHLSDLQRTMERYAGVNELGREIGKALKGKFETKNGQKEWDIEHFGYVDGISVPVMLRDDLPEPRKHWSSEAPLAQALVVDPGGQDALSFGSYFVFRKLEQNVRAFKQAEKQLGDVLGLQCDDAERAGAMIIGRFENGTPLVRSPIDQEPRFNDFTYAGDPNGQRCPFQAHIRKVNPRGESAVPHDPIESKDEQRARLPIRRGITYGNRTDLEDKDLSPDEPPEDGVGLLFMAYQHNIEEQFEFIQRRWVNDPDYVRQNTGLDPLIGTVVPEVESCSRLQEVEYHWPVRWGQDEAPKPAPLTIGGFVTLKGGEYFFAPSISFLRSL
jgi:Dyp-type peroxidase family